MKNIVSACCIILLLTCNRAYSQDTIHWSPNYRLTWADFQCKSDTASPDFATTSSGIDYTYTYTDSSFTFRVFAFFDRKNSWKKPLADSNLLKHERGHFDIAEIAALKLKNELTKFTRKFASIDTAISTMAQKILDEEENMQRSYDEETNFGKDIAAQTNWLGKIAEALKNNMAATGKY